MARRSSELKVHVENDEYGLPVVSWVEPRREWKTTLRIFSKQVFPNYNARCWFGIVERTGELTFSFRSDGYCDEQGVPYLFEMPLSNLAGFSIHTLAELYADGSSPKTAPKPDEEVYRDNLVLVADYKQLLVPGCRPYYSLARTTACRSEVMALHATLTDAFLVNADTLKPALKARQEKWKRSAIQKKWEPWLKPPVVSGGRKFVNLWEPDPKQPDETDIAPADDESESGVLSDGQDEHASFLFYGHFFERHLRGIPERWMARSAFWICSSSDPIVPELIRFSRVSLDEITSAYKPRELFKAVRLFNGAELQLPQAYMAAPDVKIDASTLILCLEFSDGELLPLTHAPASEKEGVETLREQLEYVFSGEGSGASKIVL